MSSFGRSGTPRRSARIQARQAASGGTAWNALGLIEGEYCWAWEIGNGMRILIRSSVDRTGRAADCGMDSIRLIMQYKSGDRWESCGKGPDTYTTRVHGWQSRLVSKVKYMHGKAKRVKLTWETGNAVRYSKTVANMDRPFEANNDGFVKWLG